MPSLGEFLPFGELGLGRVPDNPSHKCPRSRSMVLRWYCKAVIGNVTGGLLVIAVGPGWVESKWGKLSPREISGADSDQMP